MCWDISQEEYEEDKSFWNKWLCSICLFIERLETMNVEDFKNKYSKKVIKEMRDRIHNTELKHKVSKLI